MFASFLCYRRAAHTKPRDNLHALTLLSVLDTIGGTREFVIRRETSLGSTTSSNETIAMPTLASRVTGRHHRPALTLCSSRVGKSLRRDHREGLPGRIVSDMDHKEGHNILEMTYKSASATSCASGRASSSTASCLSGSSTSSQASEQRALHEKMSVK